MKMHTCGCGRQYNTTRDGGTAKACAKCLARTRRGGLKRGPMVSRRTNVMQVWFNDDEWQRVMAAHPDATERAAWTRDLIRAELAAREVLARMRR